MYRTAIIIMIIISQLFILSQSLCLGKKIYGFLNQTFFPITQCDSMIRIKNQNNYHIYVDQLVQYPDQTEQYKQRTNIIRHNDKNKVNQEDLLSYVQQYLNQMKKISGQVKLPKVIPIPTRQLTL